MRKASKSQESSFVWKAIAKISKENIHMEFKELNLVQGRGVAAAGSSDMGARKDWVKSYLKELLWTHISGYDEANVSGKAFTQTMRKHFSKRVQILTNLIREESRKTIGWIKVAEIMLTSVKCGWKCGNAVPNLKIYDCGKDKLIV